MWITPLHLHILVYDSAMKKRKERAKKQLRVYPKSHAKLRAYAYKNNLSLAAAFDALCSKV